ncbi:MAG: hypothetical protein IAF38_02675 [Bacteroidia bacterium]|nr:hypothetical protein [Bacteroidia bacterium]
MLNAFRKKFWLRWLAFCSVFFIILFGTLPFVSLKGFFPELVYTPIVADLHQNYYGGSSFDIGEHSIFTPGKILMAVFTGLFRPLEFSENHLLTISSIENIVLLNLFLFSFIWLVFRFIRPNKNSGSIGVTAICFFILWMAFFYGISMFNFGALMRNKTIYEPFLFFLLLIPLFRIADLRKKDFPSVI